MHTRLIALVIAGCCAAATTPATPAYAGDTEEALVRGGIQAGGAVLGTVLRNWERSHRYELLERYDRLNHRQRMQLAQFVANRRERWNRMEHEQKLELMREIAHQRRETDYRRYNLRNGNDQAARAFAKRNAAEETVGTLQARQRQRQVADQISENGAGSSNKSRRIMNDARVPTSQQSSRIRAPQPQRQGGSMPGTSLGGNRSDVSSAPTRRGAPVMGASNTGRMMNQAGAPSTSTSRPEHPPSRRQPRQQQSSEPAMPTATINNPGG